MSETRRDALKILGAVGATCAFPFEGDELHGQHAHPPAAAASAAPQPSAPLFFTPAEHVVLSAVTDAIIPPTETPGAAGAGVPEYIDRVVSGNAALQPVMRDGLAWLERKARRTFSRPFRELNEEEQRSLLQPLSDAVDREARALLRTRFKRERQRGRVYYVAVTDRTPPARRVPAPPPGRPAPARLPFEFFVAVKRLTADGYYTSRVGLLDELGYRGNTALAGFPACHVPEH